MSKVQVLDCTLRDGAYIVDSKFGVSAIKGIIKKVQDANIDIIECGWLKNAPHEDGSTFFHVPNDILPYIGEKEKCTTYVAMIDWDRYDLNNLPENNGKALDAIRVVFPKEKIKEGIALGQEIKAKGYKVYFQAANTLGYSTDELLALADEINRANPESLSVVDTFGAMYPEDLSRILDVLDKRVNQSIKLGFHSHNNQQLSFALSIQFIEYFSGKERDIIVDSSLCGMGRGAGNTTTELMVNYLNRKYSSDYDVNMILDAIDMYMKQFVEKYSWGYSIPYLISGFYCAHVNNIAYLLNDHNTNSIGIRNIIESLSPADRTKYDYDLLERKYIEYENNVIDDEKNIEYLKEYIKGKNVLMLLPGKTIVTEREKINNYIEAEDPIIIWVNTIDPGFDCDFLFFSNDLRYNYAKESQQEFFFKYIRICTSNVTCASLKEDIVINFNLLVKRGWDHFDNAGIMCIRLLDKLHAKGVAIAGFDGFENGKNYFDANMPKIDPRKKWSELNDEIASMLDDVRKSVTGKMDIRFITTSKFVLEGK